MTYSPEGTVFPARPEARAGALVWRGPGRTAFFLARGAGGGRGPSKESDVSTTVARSARQARAWIGELGASGREGVERFFEAGGREARLVLSQGRGEGWSGFDAGPGARAGLPAILDPEDIGCAVVEGLGDALRDELLGLAERAPDIFWIASRRAGLAAEPGRDAEPPSRPRPNVLLLAPGPSGRAGQLAGRLELEDPSAPLAGGRLLRGAKGSSDASRARAGDGWLEPLRRWRVRSALRRSIDLGTRWVLFEPDSPALHRRVEREVRAFLARLVLDGLLPPWGDRDARVRCEPVAREPTGGTRLRLTVRVRGSALLGDAPVECAWSGDAPGSGD